MAGLPPSDWPMARQGHKMRAAGRDFWVVEAGPIGAPVLLLLHGVGASGHSFRRLAPKLAETFRVIVPDLPGHGFSTGLRHGRSGLVPMADDLARLCDDLHVQPAAIIGHSAGAAIALQMALTPGPRTVIGINAALRPFGGPAGLLFPALARGLSLLPLAPSAFARLWGQPAQVRRLLEATGSKVDPEMMRLYLALVRKPDHVAAALRMMAEWNLDPLIARLADLKLPVLLVTGANDRTVPPEISEEASRILPLARHLSIPRVGHLAQEEAEDGLAAVISTHLNEVLGP